MREPGTAKATASAPPTVYVEAAGAAAGLVARRLEGLADAAGVPATAS